MKERARACHGGFALAAAELRGADPLDFGTHDGAVADEEGQNAGKRGVGRGSRVAVDQALCKVGAVELLEKSGGKSGRWVRSGA